MCTDEADKRSGGSHNYLRSTQELNRTCTLRVIVLSDPQQCSLMPARGGRYFVASQLCGKTDVPTTDYDDKTVLL